MEIGDRQHLAPPRREPSFLRPRLAQRAMPVAAGVIDMACRTAGVANLHMTAQGGGAAREDSAPDLRLGIRQGVGREISRAMTTQHLGQAHPGGGVNHAGALSAWAPRAVPEEKWCRSDVCAPDAHS